MKRQRRLRKLVPDADLIQRRAAGETLRELAVDYEVEHTTLGRYFARPEVAKEVSEAKRVRLAEERAVADRRAEERRLEQEVRREAREQGVRERKYERHVAAAAAQRSSRRRPRTEYEAWLDERDARLPLTRRDLWSRGDEIAAAVVAEGGGIEAVIAATGSRTLENVVSTIDPALVKQAYDNDLLAGAQRSTVRRRRSEVQLGTKRRAANDCSGVRRRATG
jgi:hypothetical protein